MNEPVRISVVFDAQGRPNLQRGAADLDSLSRSLTALSARAGSTGRVARMLENNLNDFGASLHRRVIPVVHAFNNSFERMHSIIYRVGALSFAGMIGGFATVAYSLQKLGKEFISVNQKFAELEITMKSVYGSIGVAREMRNEIARITVESPLKFADIAAIARSLSAMPAISARIAQQGIKEGGFGNKQGFFRQAVETVEQLTTFRPDKDTQDAIFAIREAVAGEMRSLVRRFEFPTALLVNASGKPLDELKRKPDEMMKALKSALDVIISPQAVREMARQPSKLWDNLIEQIKDIPLLRIGTSGEEAGKAFYTRFTDFFYMQLQKSSEFIKTRFEPFAKEISAALNKGFNNALKLGSGITEKVLSFFKLDTVSLPGLSLLERSFTGITRLVSYASSSMPVVVEYLEKTFHTLVPVITGVAKLFAILLEPLSALFQMGPLAGGAGLLAFTMLPKMVAGMANLVGSAFIKSSQNARMQIAQQSIYNPGALPAGKTMMGAPGAFRTIPAYMPSPLSVIPPPLNAVSGIAHHPSGLPYWTSGPNKGKLAPAQYRKPAHFIPSNVTQYVRGTGFSMVGPPMMGPPPGHFGPGGFTTRSQYSTLPMPPGFVAKPGAIPMPPPQGGFAGKLAQAVGGGALGAGILSLSGLVTSVVVPTLLLTVGTTAIYSIVDKVSSYLGRNKKEQISKDFAAIGVTPGDTRQLFKQIDSEGAFVAALKATKYEKEPERTFDFGSAGQAYVPELNFKRSFEQTVEGSISHSGSISRSVEKLIAVESAPIVTTLDQLVEKRAQIARDYFKVIDEENESAVKLESSNTTVKTHAEKLIAGAALRKNFEKTQGTVTAMISGAESLTESRYGEQYSSDEEEQLTRMKDKYTDISKGGLIHHVPLLNRWSAILKSRDSSSGMEHILTAVEANISSVKSVEQPFSDIAEGFEEQTKRYDELSSLLTDFKAKGPMAAGEASREAVTILEAMLKKNREMSKGKVPSPIPDSDLVQSLDDARSGKLGLKAFDNMSTLIEGANNKVLLDHLPGAMSTLYSSYKDIDKMSKTAIDRIAEDADKTFSLLGKWGTERGFKGMQKTFQSGLKAIKNLPSMDSAVTESQAAEFRNEAQQTIRTFFDLTLESLNDHILKYPKFAEESKKIAEKIRPFADSLASRQKELNEGFASQTLALDYSRRENAASDLLGGNFDNSSGTLKAMTEQKEEDMKKYFSQAHGLNFNGFSFSKLKTTSQTGNPYSDMERMEGMAAELDRLALGLQGKAADSLFSPESSVSGMAASTLMPVKLLAYSQAKTKTDGWREQAAKWRREAALGRTSIDTSQTQQAEEKYSSLSSVQGKSRYSDQMQDLRIADAQKLAPNFPIPKSYLDAMKLDNRGAYGPENTVKQQRAVEDLNKTLAAYRLELAKTSTDVDVIARNRELAAGYLETAHAAKLAREEVEGKNRNMITSFTTGFGQVVSNWRAMAQNFNDIGATLANGLSTNLGNAFSNIVLKMNSAKEAFQQFGQSMLQMAVQLLMQKAVQSVLGYAFSALSPTAAIATNVTMQSQAGMAAFALPRAEGGIIPGAPSRTDNTLAMVASGEYIIPTSVVQRFGKSHFDYYRRGEMPPGPGNLPVNFSYASGGYVGNAPAIASIPRSQGGGATAIQNNTPVEIKIEINEATGQSKTKVNEEGAKQFSLAVQRAVQEILLREKRQGGIHNNLR